MEPQAGNRVTVKSWYSDERFAGKEVTVVKNTRSGLLDIVTDAGEAWTLHKENVTPI